jgi:hypothetical protein
MQIEVQKIRDVTIAVLRTVVAVLWLALVAAALIDRSLVNMPMSVPNGQELFWYAAASAAVCWGCR